MKTEDRGESWESFQSPGSFPNNIFFTNEQDGIISANSTGNTYYTQNGGEDWRQSQFELSTSGSRTIGGIFFINENIGWASIWSLSIQKTTNGGQSWQQQFLHPGFEAREVYFVDENNGWAIGYSGTGRLYHTADGGENWELQLSMFRDYFDVFFLTPQLGWVAAEDNSVCRSIDGGNTWACFPVMTDEAIGIQSIYFSNDSIGWIADGGHKGVFITTDGGQEWRQQYIPGVDESGLLLFGEELLMLSDTLGYFCARAGKIYRYRGRPAPCGPALLPVQDSTLYPLLRWHPAEGCFDGYYLQLGTAPGGADILPRTDVGWDTAYQVAQALPASTQLFATIVPYNHVYGAAEGCNSTAFTTIDCPPAPAVIDTGFCEGGAFHFMHTVFEEPGAYAFPLTDALGCDSTITLQLAAWPVYNLTVDTALQAGTPYQGVVYAQDTSFTQHYTSAQGCDSTVQVNLHILVDAAQGPPKPASALRCFPNPATGVLHLEARGFPAGPARLSIRNSTGQLMRQESLYLPEGEARRRVDLEGWPAGVYFVAVQAGGRMGVGRVVKLQ